MAKADHYRSRAELCDRRAVGNERDIAAFWRSIADQYRFLEAVERRVADRWQLTERRPTEMSAT